MVFLKNYFKMIETKKEAACAAPCYPFEKHPAIAQMVKITTAMRLIMNQFHAALGPAIAVMIASSFRVCFVVSCMMSSPLCHPV